MLSLSLSLNTSAGFRPTNLLQHSGAFDLWTPLGVGVGQNVANGPRGDAVADRITESTGLTQHSLTPASISFVSGTAYTFSVYAKYETAQFVQLLMGSAAFGANAWGNFDIQNGLVQTMGSAATGAVVDLGNGWYRISLTVTANASAAAPTVIFGANAGNMTRALSYTGSASNTRLLANAQVESGSKANLYVATA